MTESQLSMVKGGTKLIHRFAMQSAARELMPREGVAKCMRATFPREDGTSGVDILYAPVKHAAHWPGFNVAKAFGCAQYARPKYQNVGARIYRLGCRTG